MRGGAIPLLAWGTLLLVLFIGNWIWDKSVVNQLAAASAALIVYTTALLLIWRAGRRALRRGPPEADRTVEAVPQNSSGAAIAALAFASIVFGFTFGSFLVYFGAGLMVIALGRIAVERQAQRRTVERTRGSRQ